MGKIKNYYNDFKENFKLVVAEDKESKTDKNEVADTQIINELKKELTEEKKEKLIMIGAVTGLLIVAGLIISILYLCFNKPIKKMVNDYINKIPIYNSETNDNNTNTNDNNTNINDNTNTNNNDNNNNNSSTGCTTSFNAGYKFNNEELSFNDDGSYTKYIGDDLIDFGNYTIDKSIITVTISNDNNINYQITYNVTKDCSKITETSTGQVYQRQ